MQEIEKYHRIIGYDNAHGQEEDWLAIDCAHIESGLLYAKKNQCKRILFGSLDDTKEANKVRMEILEKFNDLEGLIWQIPVPSRSDMSALHTLKHLKYLRILQKNLSIDLSVFPDLEYFGYHFSENVTGYSEAYKLCHVSVYGMLGDMAYLGAIKNLEKLDIFRANIKSLSGVERLLNLVELRLVGCTELMDVRHGVKLNRLRTFFIDGSGRFLNLSALSEFDALENLWLKMKKIESCGFISSMKSIEFASINADIVDNDLSPLLKSETLEEVWFHPVKRTYYPKFTPIDINKILQARGK